MGESALITLISVVISAVITATATIIAAIINSKGKEEKPKKDKILTLPGTELNRSGRKPKRFLSIYSSIYIAISLIAIAVVARQLLLLSLTGFTLLSTKSPTPPPLTPSPTSVPRGVLFLNIDFNEKSDGYCNDYDANVLGYESHQYYIQPLSPAGYISHCQSGIWDSVGSLEVDAYPTGDLSVFGYGVLIGWKGNATGTTDMCMFGVKRDYVIVNKNDTPEYFPYTQVVTHQRIGGKTNYPDKVKYLDYVIDENLHKIRMVMLDENNMLGYLDDVLIATYSFRECGEGGIGLVAWGTGKTKVYFDNLILSGLP